MTVTLGTLTFVPATSRPDLLAAPVAAALCLPAPGLPAPGLPAPASSAWTVPADAICVAEIDPDLADTAAFCERYGVLGEESANCVVIAGRREGETRYAACVILATTRADVNNVARRVLDVRKASFAPTETAVAQTSMEYGGITPIGLPAGWPILVDAAVVAAPLVVIGSGIRGSKLALAGKTLADLPGATVVEGLAR